MHVLHVYRTYFPDPPGGLQEAIRQIALASATQGVESRVFTLSPDPLPRRIDRPEAQVFRCRSWAAPASCDLGDISAFRSFKELTDWADVIHYHFPWPFAALLDLVVRPRTPSVMTYHSDIVRQRFLGRMYSPLMKWKLGRLRAIIATSPAYAKTSPILADIASRNRLHVIPLGIGEQSYPQTDRDSALLDRLGLDDGEPFFLFIGVLRYYKGLHFLVQASAAVNARIVVVGSGPEFSPLQSAAQNQKLKNFIFTGQVSDQEKATLLRNCFAFVLPSHLRSEAFGMVLVEASMFSKPMVSCEIGTGTSFVNVDGETGFVVPPGSPGALADSMNALLNDKVMSERFGCAARSRYEALFSGPALGQAHARLYRAVTSD